MGRPSLALRTVASAFLLGLLLPLAAAHGDDEHNNMNMDMSMPEPAATPVPAESYAPNYFAHPDHRSLMYAHIALMTLGWVFVLPVGVLLSIARYRFALLVQFIFLAVNAIGILLATIYNASTPDLYPNNAHHKLGWVVTWIMVAQIVMGVITIYTGRQEREPKYLPVSSEAMAEHHRWQGLRSPQAGRFSNDSGQGTERNTESLRSQSISSSGASEDLLPSPLERPGAGESNVEDQGLLRGTKVDQFLSKRIPGMLSSRVLRVGQFLYDVVDRTILLVGFAALTSGIVTYSGLFMGHGIFSGLAHFIKGGVFFWFGILTLGRWAGCFADIGWAWNIRPLAARNVKRPSAEFVESFLIFFYGSTNVFLEHLGGWGGKWSATDFEHISITIMFIGGGLCGMLIESSRIRDLLNSTSPSALDLSYDAEEEKALEPPKSYGFPMNPIPALIILLLGLMMSSHHQESMVSTMIHKQWGTLLLGAAFARGATYVIFYLSPPTSVLPGRPPTELITAFCLIAGGMLFMSSAADCITAMEHYGLDAMFIFTVSMGVVTFLMAWIILAVAIKGLAVRREKRASNDQHQYRIVA